MSAWTKFVTEHFRAQQKKNPNYKFRDALKDAAKLYKKPAASAAAAASGGSTQKKSKSKKRRTVRRRR